MGPRNSAPHRRLLHSAGAGGLCQARHCFCSSATCCARPWAGGANGAAAAVRPSGSLPFPMLSQRAAANGCRSGPPVPLSPPRAASGARRVVSPTGARRRAGASPRRGPCAAVPRRLRRADGGRTRRVRAARSGPARPRSGYKTHRADGGSRWDLEDRLRGQHRREKHKTSPNSEL